MQRSMLHPAVIPIHRAPICQSFLRRQGMIVVRIHIAEKIPGRAGPLRHGVGFSLGRAATARTGRIDPIRHIGKRTFPIVGRLITIHFR